MALLLLGGRRSPGGRPFDARYVLCPVGAAAKVAVLILAPSSFQRTCMLTCKDRSRGRRYQTRFLRAAARQSGAHTNRPNRRKRAVGIIVLHH